MQFSVPHPFRPSVLVDISDLPAGGFWSLASTQAAPFDMAVVTLLDWNSYESTHPSQLRVIDLTTGAVVAGRALAAGELLLPTIATPFVYHTATPSDNGALIVHTYRLLPGSDHLSAVSDPITLSLPTDHSWDSITAFAPPSGLTPGLLVTSSQLGTPSVVLLDAQGTGTPVALPEGVWSNATGFVGEDGHVYLNLVGGFQPHSFNDSFVPNTTSTFRLDTSGPIAQWVQVQNSDYQHALWDAYGEERFLRQADTVVDLTEFVTPDYQFDVTAIGELLGGQQIVRLTDADGSAGPGTALHIATLQNNGSAVTVLNTSDYLVI